MTDDSQSAVAPSSNSSAAPHGRASVLQEPALPKSALKRSRTCRSQWRKVGGPCRFYITESLDETQISTCTVHRHTIPELSRQQLSRHSTSSLSSSESHNAILPFDHPSKPSSRAACWGVEGRSGRIPLVAPHFAFRCCAATLPRAQCWYCS